MHNFMCDVYSTIYHQQDQKALTAIEIFSRENSDFQLLCNIFQRVLVALHPLPRHHFKEICLYFRTVIHVCIFICGNGVSSLIFTQQTISTFYCVDGCCNSTLEKSRMRTHIHRGLILIKGDLLVLLFPHLDSARYGLFFFLFLSLYRCQTTLRNENKCIKMLWLMETQQTN